MTTTAPKAPSIPRPPAAPAATAAPAIPTRPAVRFGAIDAKAAGHRALMYGPGGVGKTTLAAFAPGPVAIVDLDESLPRLRAALEAAGIVDNIRTVDGIADWTTLLATLNAPGWDAIKTIVVDTATKAEELAVAWTLANVPNGNAGKPARIEDYGYGKGYTHVFDTFMQLIAALDRHARAGRNVILIAHDCTANVPNPAGEDWLRFEPRLQTQASGKASIRLRLKEWADHVLFIGYDVAVDKEGKGRGAGTRTLYPQEFPFCMAKSRTFREIVPIAEDGTRAELWNRIFG